MDPAYLIAEAERLHRQIAKEPDPALRRQMEKTFKHYHREIRRATKHHQPWYGLKSNLAFLVLLMMILVGSGAGIAHFLGVTSYIAASLLTIAALIILIAVSLLLMRVITPEMYERLTISIFQGITNFFNKNGASINSANRTIEGTPLMPRHPAHLPETAGRELAGEIVPEIEANDGSGNGTEND